MMAPVVRVQQQHDDDDHDLAPCVPFVPFRCPRCGRHKPQTYAVRGRIRYHRCLSCACVYKSVECGPESVTRWTAPTIATT